jgi:hypothetical protein
MAIFSWPTRPLSSTTSAMSRGHCSGRVRIVCNVSRRSWHPGCSATRKKARRRQEEARRRLREPPIADGSGKLFLEIPLTGREIQELFSGCREIYSPISPEKARAILLPVQQLQRKLSGPRCHLHCIAGFLFVRRNTLPTQATFCLGFDRDSLPRSILLGQDLGPPPR